MNTARPQAVLRCPAKQAWPKPQLGVMLFTAPNFVQVISPKQKDPNHD